MKFKPIDKRIDCNELNQQLKAKFSTMTVVEFDKYLDFIRESVITSPTFKNDFQSSKRRLIISNWNRELNYVKHNNNPLIS